MANEQPPRNRPLERRPEQRKAGSGHTETQATELLISNPWTRSPGRLRFRTMVQHSLTLGGSKQDYLFAVLYVDLDRFKLVNASLGRELADQLLQEVARRLRDCLRTGDIITRLREDEYLIFLDDVQH